MNKTAQEHYAKYSSLYEKAVKEYVCSRCIDMTEDGFCSKDPKDCAILRYMPELVGIALELHEKKVEPYVKLVRERICANCGSGGVDGESCLKRKAVECDLDRYLPMVLDAIEDVEEKIEALESSEKKRVEARKKPSK